MPTSVFNWLGFWKIDKINISHLLVILEWVTHPKSKQSKKIFETNKQITKRIFDAIQNFFFDKNKNQ